MPINQNPGSGDVNGYGISEDSEAEEESKDSSTRKVFGGKDAKSSDNTHDPSKDYAKGDLVWLRIKGYPMWPCLVAQPSDIPRNNRKVTYEFSVILRWAMRC